MYRKLNILCKEAGIGKKIGTHTCKGLKISSAQKSRNDYVLWKNINCRYTKRAGWGRRSYTRDNKECHMILFLTSLYILKMIVFYRIAKRILRWREKRRIDRLLKPTWCQQWGTKIQVRDISTVVKDTVIVKSSVSNEPVEGFLKVFPAELRINFSIRVLLYFSMVSAFPACLKITINHRQFRIIWYFM